MGLWKSKKRWEIDVQVSAHGDWVPVFTVFEMDSPDALSRLCLSNHSTLREAKEMYRDQVFWEDLVDEAEAVNEVLTPREERGHSIYDKRVTVSRGMPWR